MSQPTRPSPFRSLLLLIGALACAATLAACGSDDAGDSSTSSSADDGSDIETLAQALADCTTEAGLDGTVTEPAIPNALAVDLTTKYQTIIVEVFATPEEANEYENEAGLDQEVVDNYVIIGGLIKPAQRDIIVGCFPSGS